jgi:hypothetical protein
VLETASPARPGAILRGIRGQRCPGLVRGLAKIAGPSGKLPRSRLVDTDPLYDDERLTSISEVGRAAPSLPAYVPKIAYETQKRLNPLGGRQSGA